MDTVVTPRRMAKAADFANYNSNNQTGEEHNDGLVNEITSALGISTDAFNLNQRRILPKPAYYSSWNRPPVLPVTDPTKVLNFVVIAVKDANAKVKPLTDGVISVQSIKINDTYNIIGHGYYYGVNNPVLVEVGINGQIVPIVGDFKTFEKLLGLRVTETGDLIGGNRVFSLPAVLDFLNGVKVNETGETDTPLSFGNVSSAFSIFSNPESALTVIRALVRKVGKVTVLRGRGIDKVNKVVAPLAQAAAELDPLALIAFRSLVEITSRTIDGVRISALFNDTFAKVTNKFEFLSAIEPMKTSLFSTDTTHRYRAVESAVKALPGYAERAKTASKSRTGAAHRKLMADIQTINERLDPIKFPRTHKAVTSGEIPVGTFFRTGNEIDGQYFLLNDNWQLWESMLKIDRATTIEIAKAAAPRTTYEKDLMSYFYFVTKALPAYLRKHTGKSWKCFPKLVDDSNELTPPTTAGTVRKRSALTPIVDNVKNTVIVPYASLSVYGQYGTTYCYSHNYEVLRDGLSVNGNTVTQDLETKLNGRDDYGLMFFTLTGSDQGRGYPTFLIIFERLERGTRVHFHRTHPSRSKNGDVNPIHNWIKTNYNWMIGNVNRDRIKAQQGDLAFVTTDAVGLEFNTTVNNYDHHCFEGEVPFAKYTKAEKSNILGYVKLASDTKLTHNEHDPRLIPAGTYEIRQCRSWEANPAGVWSLRID